MLVISRRRGEWVDLPGVGSIVVVSIAPGVVTLGFDIPKEQAIYRREVTLQMQAGKEDDGK